MRGEKDMLRIVKYSCKTQLALIRVNWEMIRVGGLSDISETEGDGWRNGCNYIIRKLKEEAS